MSFNGEKISMSDSKKTRTLFDMAAKKATAYRIHEDTHYLLISEPSRDVCGW